MARELDGRAPLRPLLVERPQPDPSVASGREPLAVVAERQSAWFRGIARHLRVLGGGVAPEMDVVMLSPEGDAASIRGERVRVHGPPPLELARRATGERIEQ